MVYHVGDVDYFWMSIHPAIQSAMEKTVVMDLQTSEYYRHHAKEYIDKTLRQDVSCLVRLFASVLPKGAKILDMGCGSGRDLRIFKQLGFDPTGIDCNQEFVDFASRYAGVPVFLGDIEHLPFEDGTFDGIWACAVLVHADERAFRNSLMEAIRVAKQGAAIFISVKKGTGQIRDSCGRFFSLFTEEQIRTSLSNASLDFAILEENKSSDGTLWLNILAHVPEKREIYTLLGEEKEEVSALGEEKEEKKEVSAHTLLSAKKKDVRTPLTVQVANQWATAFLKSAGISDDWQEAKWLVDHLMSLTRKDVYSFDPLTQEEENHFWEFLRKRTARCPLAYLIGYQNFMEFEFCVTPDVLIPRPETELMVEYAVQACKKLDSAGGKPCEVHFLDIGTGSGCIAISLLKYLPNATVWATDISHNALDVARKNARRHEVEDRIRFLQGDLFQAIPNPFAFEFILSNPPYISETEYKTLMPEVRDFEPKTALLAGDGLDFYRRILSESPSYLKNHGELILEMGYNQCASIVKMVVPPWHLHTIVRDDAGIDRVLVLRIEKDAD